MSPIPVGEAQRRILADAAPLSFETIDLLPARGRYLSEPVIARRDQPWTDLSAMDGYAIDRAGLPGPWTVVGESRAGGPPPGRGLQPGEAMRIFTGAPMPAGANYVLLQEDVSTADGLRLTVPVSGRIGQHVRGGGSDFAKGDRVLDTGSRMDAATIALVAMAGHDRVAVHRAPRMAILSTGDELVAVGETAQPDRLPASNGVMLSALVTAAGGHVASMTLAPDDLDGLAEAFAAAATSADIVVSTGGASVGDHDLVAPAIARAGGTIDFWKIALRPGKPMMAGRIGAAHILGLPGNPVSAFVTAHLFLLPLVRRMLGAPSPLPPVVPLPTRVALPAGGPRSEYLRATVTDGAIAAVLGRDSAALSPLANADVLIERPAGCAAAKTGDRVATIALRPYGFA